MLMRARFPRSLAALLSVVLLDPSAAIAGGRKGHPTPAPAPAPAPAPPPQEPRPWEEGSTQAQRDQAHSLFAQGNERFFARDYAPAIALYEQALVVFDHPRIELALARALVRVGRPADAHPHLVTALRWDAAPLDPEEYADAIELRDSLAKQLGVLVIRCATDGAQLTLDGKALLPCPSEQQQVVMPGHHEVVGKHAGFLTFTGEMVADAGKTATLDVTLHKLETTAVRRRWTPWKPWVVVGGGAAITIGGFVLRYLASNNFTRYRDDAAGCGGGCTPVKAAQYAPVESRAKLQDTLAISMWAVGGAAIATGLVGVFINRERVVRHGVETVEVTPLVSPTLVGIGLTGEL